MSRVLIDVSTLTPAQSSKYFELKIDWGEMTRSEVKSELIYYCNVCDRLQVGDPALKRFQRERDALTAYLNLFPKLEPKEPELAPPVAVETETPAE